MACTVLLCYSCGGNNPQTTSGYSEYEKPDTTNSVQEMKDYHYSAEVKVGQTRYTYDIVREVNDTLPLVTGDDGERYADNYIRLRVNREGKEIFNKVFTKNHFRRQHYVMYVNTGETQWRVYSEDGQGLALPLAITLHSFTMEEYAPKLVVIDRKTGLPQPEGKPEFFQIAPQTPQGHLGKWDIHVDTFYPRAVFAGNETFQPQEKPGSSPAVKVTVRSREDGKTQSGWISAGNMDEFMHVVNLDERYALAVTPPEPKQFISDVTVLVRGDEPVRTKIEVNSPLRIGSWIIYQYGYDQRLGRYSDFSSFEIVCDPWLPIVYAGFILMSLAAIFSICRRPARREERS